MKNSTEKYSGCNKLIKKISPLVSITPSNIRQSGEIKKRLYVYDEPKLMLRYNNRLDKDEVLIDEISIQDSNGINERKLYLIGDHKSEKFLTFIKEANPDLSSNNPKDSWSKITIEGHQPPQQENINNSFLKSCQDSIYIFSAFQSENFKIKPNRLSISGRAGQDNECKFVTFYNKDHETIIKTKKNAKIVNQSKIFQNKAIKYFISFQTSDNINEYIFNKYKINKDSRAEIESSLHNKGLVIFAIQRSSKIIGFKNFTIQNLSEIDEFIYKYENYWRKNYNFDVLIQLDAETCKP